MGKFNKTGKREMPELNTSSLPDLIFTMLFFFMIVEGSVQSASGYGIGKTGKEILGIFYLYRKTVEGIPEDNGYYRPYSVE